jgi:hypothetical protein
VIIGGEPRQSVAPINKFFDGELQVRILRHRTRCSDEC